MYNFTLYLNKEDNNKVQLFLGAELRSENDLVDTPSSTDSTPFKAVDKKVAVLWTGKGRGSSQFSKGHDFLNNKDDVDMTCIFNSRKMENQKILFSGAT